LAEPYSENWNLNQTPYGDIASPHEKKNRTTTQTPSKHPKNHIDFNSLNHNFKSKIKHSTKKQLKKIIWMVRPLGFALKIPWRHRHQTSFLFLSLVRIGFLSRHTFCIETTKDTPLSEAGFDRIVTG